jgi:drug/metabolite transporter (DMT)-like permease
MMAIKHITVSLASVLSATEPVFVLILAFLINHERASKRELIGAAITIAGLLIIILNE